MPVVFCFLTFVAADEPKVVQTEDFERLRAEIRGSVERRELRKRLGVPQHVSRQIYHRQYREQWFYDVSPGWLVELECPVGEIPRLVRVIRIPPS